MTDKHDYDDLEEEFLDDDEGGSFLGIMSVVIGFMAIVGFITLAWYAYRTGTESLQVEELEVVKADESPLKQIPEDPGGWTFPHQDKTIYETISSRKKGPGEETENTIPEPEEPIARTQTPAAGEEEKAAEKETAKIEKKPAVVEEIGKKQDTAAVEKAEKIAEKAKEASAEELAAAEPAASIMSVGSAKSKTDTAQKSAKKKEQFIGSKQRAAAKQAKKAEAKKSDKVASLSASNSKVMVQLGAFKSESEANSSWGKISAKHKDLLSGLSRKVSRADLGKKGVFYRLQVVPFAKSADARTLCDKLASRKQACFVVMSQ